MIVSTRLFFSHCDSTLSSRLFVAVTAASRHCQAAHEPATCVSTYGYGTFPFVARSRKSGTSFAAPALLLKGGCTSKTVTDIALLESDCLTSGPERGTQ